MVGINAVRRGDWVPAGDGNGWGTEKKVSKILEQDKIFPHVVSTKAAIQARGFRDGHRGNEANQAALSIRAKRRLGRQDRGTFFLGINTTQPRHPR